MQRNIFIKKDNALFILIISIIFFVIGVLFTGTFLLSQWETHFEQSLKSQTSVQIPIASLPKERVKQLEDLALVLLKDDSKVADYHLYSKDQIYALVAPWIPSKRIFSKLDLPIFISVKLRDLDSFVSFKVEFQRRIPTAIIKSNEQWIQAVNTKIRPLKIVLWGIVALLLLSSLILLVFTIYTSLRINRVRIHILNLIGAHDIFIVRHFRRYFLSLILKSMLVGFGLCALIIVGIRYVFLSSIQWINTWIFTLPQWIMVGIFIVIFLFLLERIITFASFKQLRKLY